MKYKEWLEIWLENYVKVSSKLRTYLNYRACADNHIAPRLGDLPLEKVNSFELQKFITFLSNEGNLKTGKGLSPSTVNTIVTVTESSLKTAYVAGALFVRPVCVVKRPRLSFGEARCFSVQDQKRIEQAILQSDKRRDRMFGVVLCLYTGMRIGELLALEWSDVDLKNGTLSISKTCYYAKNEGGSYARIVGEPKTYSSKRVMPLPHRLVPLLREQKKNSRSRYVVSHGENPVSVRAYQESFSKLLKNIGVRHEGFHALRHTFATRAIECGMDVKSLSEILGHGNPSITLRRYVHSLNRHKQEMMDKVGKLL